MPTQTKSGRANPAQIGTDPTFNSPKAYRSRVTQERLSKAERETDTHRLHQRQKQIDYGKNTSGYLNYVYGVPMETRSRSDPWTPDIYKKYPKRVWDVIVRTWRRQLHKYDEDMDPSSFDDSPSMDDHDMAALNDSLSSEDDLIDSINDAIQKFQQEEQTPEDSEYSSSSSQLDSLIYSFDSHNSSSQGSIGESSASHMTPYSSRVASMGFGLPEDSNSSMDSATSTPASLFSDNMSVDYLSENSSDSWTSMPLTPISMLGSPFQPLHRSSSLVSTPTSFRGASRSASQHYGASASQHSSPYGPIGQIPRFQLPASPLSTSSSKFISQDENVENTSQLF